MSIHIAALCIKATLAWIYSPPGSSRCTSLCGNYFGAVGVFIFNSLIRSEVWMCWASQTVAANEKWKHSALMMELAFCCGAKYIQVKRFTVTQEGSDFLHKLLTNTHSEICRGQYREQQATTTQMTHLFRAFILIFHSLSHRYKK